ncbi:cyclic nucleotide-gated ion channel 1-like [Pyrus ussuriensis x Pyrus communis]|uniref:Cyclic nucleotide-gated ion channel 1-like n=1 Tax=Pyrus ussuriensis x Pyrus communis TaxID=2448454 RepID=A0A5N5H7B2_9ROSA|nr:cyclic nucleotide-gated ion channel 1-like [Pyrus ussuriensis x Pyrus communis]
MWNALFMLSCVLVSPDPLFCYVVNFKDDEKCLQMDERLKIVALVLRSLTDVIFLVHLICEILALKMSTSKNEQSEAGKQRLQSMLSIITDVLALIPFPQLAVLMFYGSEFVENKTLVNVFLLGQYVPRVIRIHLSGKVFKRMNGRWANCVFNLSLYIFAGHVLGAVWYLFSIQRAVSCWYKACVKCIGNCEGILYCNNVNTARPLNQICSAIENSTANVAEYLKDSCPLDTPDGASPPFNFGIFLDSLKNENPDQEFGQKFVYSFWWGLRNLSNFGTNLVTSTYVLENLFAILISVIGLLLFIYLIGNVEVFMQTGATQTLYMGQQRKKKKEAIKTLKEIPMLKDMDEEVLKMMCDYLKPATYVKNSFVFRTGDPLDCMLLIIEGTMWTYTSSDSHAGQVISSMAIKALRKGDFYGEELLDCASDFTQVPVSSKHVKSHTKVEALVLMAEDLVSILRQHGDLLNRNNPEKAQRRPPPSPAEIGDDNSSK